MLYLIWALLLVVGAIFLTVLQLWRNWRHRHYDHKPGHGISLLVPFRTDFSHRELNWEWLHRYWETWLPGAEIVVGHNDHIPFCKTSAVNDAFRRATGDVVVILDADCFIDSDVILHCADRIRTARSAGHKLWFIPYRRFYRLTKKATLKLVESPQSDPYLFTDPPSPHDLATIRGSSNGHWFGAMIQIMPREAFVVAGGMDTRFYGWGGEDIAFMRAVDTLYAKHKTSDNDTLHLWHPTILGGVEQVRMWPGQETPGENGPLAARYHAAFGDRARMLDLVRGDLTNNSQEDDVARWEGEGGA